MEPKQSRVNYIYFASAFLLMILLVSSSLSHKENLGTSQFFFFLYALGQAFLEVSLFIFLSIQILHYLGKFCFGLFIGGTFLISIVHLLDAIMDRILDLTIWETLRVFVFDESLDNFRVLLDASGVPLWTWLIIFSLLASLPLLGILVYKITDKISEKKPLFIRHSTFLQAFVCIPCALLFWDFSASKVIHPDAYSAFIKSLPWKFTFLRPENVLYSLPGNLRKPTSETVVSSIIEQDQTVLEKKPNIYIFVVESLREDAITETIAPNLNQFKNAYTHFDLALSNGNGTQLSWFSIFHSQFSYLWQQAQKSWQKGSPALQLLKKWGYQIRLYSSADLSYYGMEKLIFGNNLQLLDTRQTFHHAPPLQAADSDAEALAKMQQDLAENPNLQQGQVFIIFWDCTHFDYSWPKNWSPKFTPYAKEFAYFRAFHSENKIDQIKRRYWNSVNYMDSLFGNFLKNLPKKEESIVIFTGDHGEEFFEQGHLFHNSHIVHEQTNVPLYFKFGNNERPVAQHQLASQMDIFPSLLEYLSNKSFSFLEGNSLFQKTQWPFVITSRFNAGRTPYEFMIHNGTNKVIAQFSNEHNIFEAKDLQILSLRTRHEKSIPEFKNNVTDWVDHEFGPAIERLFEERAPESFRSAFFHRFANPWVRQ